ncbi:hypothetical protein [Flavobacterium gilvum]|uniref:Uncharacterized protein n=1 Tax=Flavobacterium gilvum TaxID=1492737 RepID=A0AAC9N3Y8_9FLAO|nr:hypothetical protein [Flavobacterium gilvum]AOW09745.1 hypothetical protein EM308_09645 [Flavobacterium gilvum]KFC60398.1 hypothetical protein FEM08_08750 [Flavobacterium gilvum]
MEANNAATINNIKTKKLVLGILFDAIGMLSFTIPYVGEFGDVVWAPLAGFLMAKMYEGRVGKVASILTFAEEILPFTDVVPSFTLTWIYMYWIKKDADVKKINQEK